jgi:hypothetical protein
MASAATGAKSSRPSFSGQRCFLRMILPPIILPFPLCELGAFAVVSIIHRKFARVSSYLVQPH